MESKKNDRPAWINKVFDEFLEEFLKRIEILQLTSKLLSAISNKEELIQPP
jgi:predicted ribosome quality control (RQC) complex YloA/Tae2 family protein